MVDSQWQTASRSSVSCAFLFLGRLPEDNPVLPARIRRGGSVADGQHSTAPLLRSRITDHRRYSSDVEPIAKPRDCDRNCRPKSYAWSTLEATPGAAMVVAVGPVIWSPLPEIAGSRAD
jgi:hypothetical protein